MLQMWLTRLMLFVFGPASITETEIEEHCKRCQEKRDALFEEICAMKRLKRNGTDQRAA